jgi:hypothetical protein
MGIAQDKIVHLTHLITRWKGRTTWKRCTTPRLFRILAPAKGLQNNHGLLLIQISNMLRRLSHIANYSD